MAFRTEGLWAGLGQAGGRVPATPAEGWGCHSARCRVEGGFGFYAAPSDFRVAPGRAGTPAQGPSLPRKSHTGRDLEPSVPSVRAQLLRPPYSYLKGIAVGIVTTVPY